MEFNNRSVGLGILVALIVLAFTFGTSLLTAGLQSYNLAISVAFAMGGIFCICLTIVLKMVHASGEESIKEDSIKK